MDHPHLNLVRPGSFPLHAIAPNLRQAAGAFRERLFGDILPLWSVVGIDRTDGGFVESLSCCCQVEAVPRRIRVTARQVFSFATAAEMGWNETAARICVDHGYRFLVKHSSPEGFLAHSIDHKGECLDPGHDLYDQAFLLLAYAKAYKLTGDDAITLRADGLLRELRHRFVARDCGLVDHLSRDQPLRANPHMHLLEAALHWIDVRDTTEWRDFADDLVDLFMTRFFDRTSGFVLEDFDTEWQPILDAGRIRIEPGHQFEWAWLLMRWERLTRNSSGDVPEILIRSAEASGVDQTRKVAINTLWSDGTIFDGTARLWPQAERMKAWLAIAETSHGQEAAFAEHHAAQAAQALLSYLDTPVGGLWHDLMDEDGTFKPTASPASSLYHIICAAQELLSYCDEAPGPFATKGFSAPLAMGRPEPAGVAEHPRW